jgi:hypothetical protein
VRSAPPRGYASGDPDGCALAAGVLAAVDRARSGVRASARVGSQPAR